MNFSEKRTSTSTSIFMLSDITPEKPTKLYRGDKNGINPQDKLSKDYLFFTPKMEQAEQYGNVSEFETTKPLRVVALDDITEDFFNFAPEDVQNHLVSNYGYNTKQKKKIRNSTETGDFAVSQYICKQGYDGYAIDTMATDFDGTFHQEIVICNPSENVKFVNEGNTGTLSEESPSDTSDSVRKLLFGDAFDSPPSTPGGGAKRLSKMKKTKGKSKRRTKRRRQ